MATREKRRFTAGEAAKFFLESSDEDDLDELFTQENLQEELDLNGPQADSQGISSDEELVEDSPFSSSMHRLSSPPAKRLKRKER